MAIEEKEHKAGFVNIVGNPNVGKSTLMNGLVGERISIITSKAQTTRHRILGIVNGDDFQLVFSDTPGVLKPNYKLQEAMLKFSTSALTDADVLIYVTDTIEKPDKNIDFLNKVKEIDTPVFLVINKIDLVDQKKLEAIFDEWKAFLPKATVFPISALHKFNIENLFNEILKNTPVSEPFFAKDQLTDKPARFFVTEIIREKILQQYKKEIPYAVEVVVEEFKDSEKIIHIRAIINVERESQKGIIIGHKGVSLKYVGKEAREDMEEFFGKKVFLEMVVRVDKDWRNKENKLRKFGYDES